MRIAAAVVMVALGWALARDLGRFTAPALFRRMDPATAGTAGFLIRLAFLVVAAIAALRVAGLDPGTLALGGAIAAVVLGLAAQQTLGNLIAGLVLISVRPFKVGDRVRLQAGGLAGQVEGVVASLGLLYTTFAQGEDSIMVPNNVVLSAAVVPLREPAVGGPPRPPAPRRQPERRPVDARGRDHTPVRGEPTIALEEIDADEVVVRIQATPLADADGPKLADEVLAAVGAATPARRPTTSARRWPASACRPGRARTGRRSRRRRAALDRADRARGERGEHRARAQRQRRDVELGAVVLDRLHDRARDVLRALGADVRRAASRRTRRTCPRRG